MNVKNLLIEKGAEKFDKKLLLQLLNMYIQIFGVEPWNEGYVCSNCQKLFSLERKNPTCCGKVKPFYTKKELLIDFKSWYEKKGFIGIIAMQTQNNLQEPIGFNIGWETNLKQLNKDKLALNEDGLQELKKNIKLKNVDTKKMFYIADLGLVKDFRGQKIASSMFYNLMKEIEEKGYKNIIARTTKKSDVPYKWLKKIGFENVFNYNDEQDRVILVYKK